MPFILTLSPTVMVIFKGNFLKTESTDDLFELENST